MFPDYRKGFKPIYFLANTTSHNTGSATQELKSKYPKVAAHPKGCAF